MVRADESRVGYIEQVMARTQAPLVADTPELDAALPDEADDTPEETMQAIRREEARIQYSSE